MGINTTGNKLIWKATNVSTRELREIVLHNTGKKSDERINIDVDVSNVAHILSRSVSTYEDLVIDTATCLKDLANESGFVVTAIFDGDYRPHSKRDSFKRRFETVINEINCSYCRHAATTLASKITKTEDEKTKLDVLNKESKSLESKKLIIANEFYDDVKTKLEYINAHEDNENTEGFVCKLSIKAEFQADYVMAHRYI